MAKKLLINCGNCDTRNVKESTLSAYESIVINCGAVLVSPESKDLLNQYGVTLNCGNVKELDRDVQIKTINGSAQIRSSDAMTDRVYLQVNGALEIGPDTQAVLQQYVGICVNGSVTYPESVSSCLGLMSVNGATTCYPDGAIILKRNAVIDRLFALRAKKNLYWSSKRMIMVDPQLDGAVLANKGARFAAGEVILAEGKVEEMLDLIDEKAQIIIVPDGTVVVTDDVTLDDMTIHKYGRKLYVTGDVTVTKDSGNCLEELHYLNVRGDAKVTEEMKARLLAVLTQIDGDVKVVKPPKGKQIEDKMNLRISKWLLEQAPDGIHVSDCVRVALDGDIPNEMILEKLSFSDCVEIKCSEAQEPAVAAVAEDVVAIGGLGKMVQGVVDMAENATGSDMGIGDMIKSALGAGKDLLNAKVINAGDYVL